MNSTQELLTLFNTTLIEKVFKTSDKILSLSDFMNEIANKGVDEDGELETMVNKAKSSSTIRIITIFSIFELIVLVVLLIISQFPFVKRKLIGTVGF